MECKYDIDGLIEELEVRIDDIVPLFSSYYTEMREELVNMLACLSKSDWDMLRRIVHNVKGVSANLRIEDVFNTCVEFEDKLKDGNSVQADKYINLLLEIMNDSEHSVRSYFQKFNIEF